MLRYNFPKTFRPGPKCLLLPIPNNLFFLFIFSITACFPEALDIFCVSLVTCLVLIITITQVILLTTFRFQMIYSFFSLGLS